MPPCTLSIGMQCTCVYLASEFATWGASSVYVACAYDYKGLSLYICIVILNINEGTGDYTH